MKRPDETRDIILLHLKKSTFFPYSNSLTKKIYWKSGFWNFNSIVEKFPPIFLTFPDFQNCKSFPVFSWFFRRRIACHFYCSTTLWMSDKRLKFCNKGYTLQISCSHSSCIQCYCLYCYISEASQVGWKAFSFFPCHRLSVMLLSFSHSQEMRKPKVRTVWIPQVQFFFIMME